MSLSGAAAPPRVSYAELRRNLNPTSRKFGRTDVKEHYDLTKDVSVANADIGGVSVDCRFLFSKTRLGVLEDKNHPGGIIYTNLTVNQPPEWRLREVTFSIVLEDIQSLGTQGSNRNRSGTQSVEFWNECFGPNSLIGPELVGKTSKHYTVGPHAEFAGFGGGLGEFGGSESQSRSSWWKFDGTLKPANRSSAQYTNLTWTMSPNTLAYNTDHPPKVETAFAFSHSYRPFILRVEIDGKLRHIHDKFKDKAIGLFSKARKQKSVILLFKFDPGVTYNAELLEQANGLQSEMTRRACEVKQVEITPRTSSTDLHATKEPVPVPATTPIVQMRREINSVTRSTPLIDQSEVKACLRRAHHDLSTRSPEPLLQETLHAMAKSQPAQPTIITKELTREEMAEALQQMPALVYWIFCLWIGIIRRLSKESAQQRIREGSS